MAAVQNSIVLDTSAPVSAQRDAIHNKAIKFVEAAAQSNVNILCFQEAWSKKGTHDLEGEYLMII